MKRLLIWRAFLRMRLPGLQEFLILNGFMIKRKNTVSFRRILSFFYI